MKQTKKKRNEIKNEKYKMKKAPNKGWMSEAMNECNKEWMKIEMK